LLRHVLLLGAQELQRRHAHEPGLRLVVRLRRGTRPPRQHPRGGRPAPRHRGGPQTHPLHDLHRPAHGARRARHRVLRVAVLAEEEGAGGGVSRSPSYSPTILRAHSATASTSSSSTSASVRPERLSTWNEWSAPSTTCSVARSPSRACTWRISSRSARSSRVPWRKSMGTPTSSRCAARSVAGFF